MPMGSAVVQTRANMIQTSSMGTVHCWSRRLLEVSKVHGTLSMRALHIRRALMVGCPLIMLRCMHSPIVLLLAEQDWDCHFGDAASY